LVLPGLILGALLPAGCGPSTTNEPDTGRATVPTGPNPHSYADFAKGQHEQAAKEKGSRARATSKSPPKAQPEPAKPEAEPSKTEPSKVEPKGA
jgi:hypothetical protein